MRNYVEYIIWRDVKMKISMKKHDDILIVKVTGELDHHTSDLIKDNINNEYSKGYKDIILDFRKLNFMDSSGIGVILGRYKMAKLNNGSLSIVGANPQLLKVIELSGISRVIRCYNNIDDAINSK